MGKGESHEERFAGQFPYAIDQVIDETWIQIPANLRGVPVEVAIEVFEAGRGDIDNKSALGITLITIENRFFIDLDP
ncbi:MAG: hypothetical protein LC633_00135 [Desulfobulbaceae bacterium]|nr:hypothetical protein [Desulfobulbaceae bacterium]